MAGRSAQCRAYTRRTGRRRVDYTRMQEGSTCDAQHSDQCTSGLPVPAADRCALAATRRWRNRASTTPAHRPAGAKSSGFSMAQIAWQSSKVVGVVCDICVCVCVTGIRHTFVCSSSSHQFVHSPPPRQSISEIADRHRHGIVTANSNLDITFHDSTSSLLVRSRSRSSIGRRP